MSLEKIISRVGIGILFIVVMAAAGLFYGKLKRESAQTDNSNESTPSASSKYFGGGYKETKWSMSKEQVKNVVNVDSFEEGTDYLFLSSEAKKETKYWFYGDRLYMVVYEPGLRDGDNEGVTAIFNLLSEKYGSGQAIDNMVETLTGLPLRMHQWSDGETEIIFRMYADIPGKLSYLNPPASTIKIIYTSISLENEKTVEEKQETQRIEKEKTLEKQREYYRDL